MLVIPSDELDKLVSSDLSFGEVLVEIGVELQYAGFGSDQSWIGPKLDQTKVGSDQSWVGPKLGQTEVGSDKSWVGLKLGLPILVNHFWLAISAISGRLFLVGHFR